eukprot:761774-Hanusia_phi.AAC.2
MQRNGVYSRVLGHHVTLYLQISRHKSGGLSNFPEAPRIAQLQGRWLSSSDGIDASIMSGSGARSVRMTLRMPVASIGAALQAVRQNAINADRSGIAAEFFASQRIGAQPRQGHSDSPSGAVPPAASSTFDSIPNRNSEPSLSSQVGSRGRKRKADESVNEAPHVNAESSRRKRAYKRDKHLISQTDNVPHVWMEATGTANSSHAPGRGSSADADLPVSSRTRGASNGAQRKQ